MYSFSSVSFEFNTAKLDYYIKKRAEKLCFTILNIIMIHITFTCSGSFIVLLSHTQFAVLKQQVMMEKFVCLQDYEDYALQILPKSAAAFYRGGAIRNKHSVIIVMRLIGFCLRFIKIS